MKHSILTNIFVTLSIFVGCAVSQAQEYSLRFFDDSNGLSHWRTTRTLQDTTGMMWIATYNGLNRFDGQRFVAFKAADSDSLSMSSDRIRRIQLDENNNILCLIDDDVLRFNTRTCRFEALEEGVEQEVLASMRMRRNPDLWREKEVYTQMGNLRLKNIRRDYEDQQGNHWLIDDHGVYIASPIQPRGKYINHEDVRAMTRLQDGNILISSRSSKQIAVYDSAFHLLGYIQPDGRLDKRAVSFDNQPYCFYETRDGKHSFIGCKPGCLIEGDNNPQTRGLRKYEQVRNVYEVTESADGTVWAATYGFGLWKRAASEASEFEQVPGTKNREIRRLLVADDSTLLAATTRGLLVVNTKRPSPLILHQRKGNLPNSLNSNAVMCLCLFKDPLYIGTEGGGINRLIGNDWHAETLEFEHITTADGLASDIIYDIMPWSENELLVQCNSALAILGENSIANFGKSFFQTPDYRPFITGEAWPIDLGNGHILVATLDGLLLLDKSELRPENEPVRIALSTITLEGKPNYAVDHLDHLKLEPNERSMGIQFAALDYRNTADILYQTRLYTKGEKNKAWEVPTRLSEVMMQDLTPGEYVFEVRATNALGQWQDNTRRLLITVTPTFWESRAGWVLQIGLLLLITIAITLQTYRVRTHRKQREETLNAYLDLQEKLSTLRAERLSAETKDSKPASDAEPLPVPEIFVPGRLNKDEEFLNILHKFLEENMDNPAVVVDDLADLVAMSRSSLNRKMHELFNLSAKDFMQAARIKHACKLLQTTDMAAKEVAYACGFSDPRYFAKFFKANTGLTPTEYRSKESGEQTNEQTNTDEN